MSKFLSLSFLLLLCFFTALPGQAAKFTVSQIISDHMILQRDQPIKLVGTGTPGAAVQATLGSDAAATVTDEKGRWLISLPARPIGAPFTVSVESLGQKVMAQDVLAGDVYICAGQTNMLLSVAESADCKNLAIAMSEKTRFYNFSDPGKWIAAGDPELAKRSALSVAFVSKLRNLITEKIPIGIVQCTVGNANLQSWIASKDLPENLAIHKKSVTDPGAVFDQYLLPVSGLPFKAVLWYQGENDLPAFNSYPQMFALLAKSWRKRFSPEMPFFIVQLPNWGAKTPAPDGQYPLAYFREAQQKACLAPHCFLVPTINTSGDCEWVNLRNPNKLAVGNNCAQIVAGRIYQNAPTLIPRFSSAEKVGTQLKVTFSVAESGLELKDKKTRAFEIAGEDGVFKIARVSLENNVLWLTSASVHAPIYCRYGWANNVPAALFSKNGMPVAP